MHSDICMVFCNVPNEAIAQDVAKRCVEEGLAACVNVLPPCQSVYRWEGRIEEAREIPMVIKTTVDRYADVQEAILAAHPYETPEIVAIPVVNGLDRYLHWIAVETARG